MDGSTADVCMYNVLLGKMFAQVAQLVVEKCGLSMDDIAVIGSHGSVVILYGCVCVHKRERERVYYSLTL